MATPTLSAPEQGTQVYDRYIADDGYFSDTEVKAYLLDDLNVAEGSVDQLSAEFQMQAIREHKPWALMPNPPALPCTDAELKENYLPQIVFIKDNIDDPLIKQKLSTHLEALLNETGNLKHDDPKAEALALSGIMQTSAELALNYAPQNSAIKSAASQLIERETIFREAVESAIPAAGSPKAVHLKPTEIENSSSISARMHELMTTLNPEAPMTPIQSYWVGVNKLFEKSQVAIASGESPLVHSFTLAHAQQWQQRGLLQLEIKELQNRRQNLDRGNTEFAAEDDKLQELITEKESQAKIHEQSAGLFLDLLQKMIDSTTQVLAKVS